MPSITLYGPPDIPFTTKVIAALGLKKLEFQLVEPRGEEDYRRWSPRSGLLPVIEIDGEWTEDSGKILDVLDERFPEPPLLSADPKTAKLQRRLEQWAEAALVFYWIHYLREVADTGKASPEGRALAPEFEQRMDDLVNFLGDRPFFYSDTPSRADLAVYSFLYNVADALGPNVGLILDQRPVLGAYLDRVAQAVGPLLASA